MDTRRRISFNMNTGGGEPTEPSTGGTYTINLNGQWEKTTAISNPDSTLYDGVYRSSSNYNVNSGVATMYITIKDCSSFKMYIRSYAESNFDYVMVSQLDKTITGSTSYNDTTLVKAHTRGNQQSGTALSNYTLVEFTGITSGEHTITVVYRKDSSVNNNDDRGYVLISKSNGSSGSGDTSGPINTDNYLTILALEDGLTASLSKNSCQYCINGDGNWVDLPAGTTTQSINSGQTLSFKGNLTPNSSSGIGTFTISKKCNLEGNCMSLLFGDNAASNNSLSGRNYAFYNLFSGCTTIIEVSSTFLPATTLASYCYYYMFDGCSSLVTTSELPATTLASDCYCDMFYKCTSLVTAPELPATTLANNCYQSMFNNCTSLDKAPELPATTLANRCYSDMFYKCTSLVTAPELPVTTLASSCYQNMFSGCSSLVKAPAVLPATTLKDYCYIRMFYGCTSLVTAPELPATTLATYCYDSMFYGCTKLNYIKMLATNISASGCLSSWVYNVSSTGTFVKHPNMTSLPTGSNGIPSGWTVYNNGEEPEQESPQVAGDVAYYTNGEIKTISKDKWDSSLGTPIGVVVIPSNFLPDGMARIVSLKAVDSSGNATTSHSKMVWSNTDTDTTLTNYTKVPITNNTGSVSSSYNAWGYLPSDNFTGDTSFVDSTAKYGTTNTNKLPSPYNGNEFNTDYSKVISGNNVLSDFNGLSNTQVLVGLGSDYVAANAAWNYSDGVSNTQWYLPSMGELGFIVARFKTINSTISMLSGVSVPSYTFWSSTEYSSIYTYYVRTDNGNVTDSYKDGKYYVRPFALLNNSGGGVTNLITFTINGTEYQAEDGMTFMEWCGSSYNTDGFYIDGTAVLSNEGCPIENGGWAGDIIISGGKYILGPPF